MAAIGYGGNHKMVGVCKANLLLLGRQLFLISPAPVRWKAKDWLFALGKNGMGTRKFISRSHGAHGNHTGDQALISQNSKLSLRPFIFVGLSNKTASTSFPPNCATPLLFPQLPLEGGLEPSIKSARN